MAGRSLVIIGIIASLLLGIIVQQFNPTTAGPVGILAFFGLLYVIFLAIMTFAIFGASRVVSQFSRFLSLRQPILPISFLKAYYFATVVAFLPVMLLGVQSVGGLGVYDIILIALFGCISSFYVAKKIA